jgi:hypothetical protein
MTTLSFWGRNVRDAQHIAARKFSACPWQFFDGVPDCFPDQLVWGDYAITRVMNSGVYEAVIPRLSGREIRRANRVLAGIPRGCALSHLLMNDLVYSQVDQLFDAVRSPGVGMSRSAKVLCRKRPNLIPMLDSVVTNHVRAVARRWKEEPKGAPGWFLAEWKAWKAQPRFYMRMIQESMAPQLAAIREIREFVASVPSTGVPVDAGLLRIWEATLFRAKVEERL